MPDFVVKQVAINRPEELKRVFNSCLREGVIPEDRKKGKLVLMRKGKKPLDQPSSYRPICLPNTTGKMFERVLKGRLEAHLEITNGLSNRQFGFRKKKSTVDMLSKVMKLVDAASTGPLRRKELCGLAVLDVANAFNSADWKKIEAALSRK